VINAHLPLFSFLASGQRRKNSNANTMNSRELKIMMVRPKVVIAGVLGIWLAICELTLQLK
jgi:hypothetical protein